jgi:hypothetical protein
MFNKFFSSFVKELKKMDEGLRTIIKANFKVIDKSSEEYYMLFWNGVKEHMNILTSLDMDNIVTNEHVLDIEVVKGMTFGDIVKALKEEDRIVFWNYFNILLLFGYIYTEAKTEEENVSHSQKEDTIKDTENNEDTEETKDTFNTSSSYTLFLKVVKILSLIQKGEDIASEMDEIVDDDVKLLLSRVKTISVPEDAMKFEEQEGNPEDFLKNLGNSKIANLAKEISQEIDTTNLKVEGPEDIAKLLDFSGSNNLMGDIFTKVSSKLSQKIASGDLKQEDLMGEAMSMMSMLQGGGAGAGGIGDLLKNLGGLGGLGDLMNNPMMAEVMKMAKKGKVQTKTHMRNQNSTRDRLRKKLEKRNGTSSTSKDA